MHFWSRISKSSLKWFLRIEMFWEWWERCNKLQTLQKNLFCFQCWPKVLKWIPKNFFFIFSLNFADISHLKRNFDFPSLGDVTTQNNQNKTQTTQINSKMSMSLWNSSSVWSPWDEMRRFQQEFDKSLKKFDWSPAVDVKEEKESMLIHAELPGVKKVRKRSFDNFWTEISSNFLLDLKK